LYVDEFQNFATESFANILSEARKYRLNLILAHQYITQLDEKVSGAVFGNVGTLISFRVGAEDAGFLAKEFVPQFDETDLVNLDKYEVYIKLMIGGITSEPFSANTLPPLGKAEANHEKIIKVSREMYSEERKVVEDKIIRWSGMEGDESAPAADKAKFEAKCDKCGMPVFVPFVPDGVRPVYCRDCLKEAQRVKAQTEHAGSPHKDNHSHSLNTGRE